RPSLRGKHGDRFFEFGRPTLGVDAVCFDEHPREGGEAIAEIAFDRSDHDRSALQRRDSRMELDHKSLEALHEQGPAEFEQRRVAAGWTYLVDDEVERAQHCGCQLRPRTAN